MLKKLLLSLALLLPSAAWAADDYAASPRCFGPNALPVPDMLNGTVQKRFYAEVDFDLHKGFYGDLTKTIFVKANIPLFTPRVNLSLWMPVIEFYKNTPESLQHQQSLEQKTKGREFGNLYVSTDIQLLQQRAGWRPDITLRAALITASGDSEQYARYYDAPGYFFDMSIAKSVYFKDDFFKELRFVINGGFLCWQVEKSVQNDAPLYGVKAELDTKVFTTTFAWQGYSGWIDDGDKPMVIKADLMLKCKQFRPLIAYQYGLRDYPFHQFRIGLGYMF